MNYEQEIIALLQQINQKLDILIAQTENQSEQIKESTKKIKKSIALWS